MSLRARIRTRLLDWAMRQVDELRPETLAGAEGSVLEVGFGTGRNLPHYGAGVREVIGLDPHPPEGLAAVGARVAAAAFPVEHRVLRADGELPFDAGRFDCVVTTWTLCSIPDPARALAEMRRVLRPGGHYLFVEHGRADDAGTARWQDRVNPLWRRLADGCNMNRAIDAQVEAGGFELIRLERFRHDAPRLLAHMYRGVATRT